MSNETNDHTLKNLEKVSNPAKVSRLGLEPPSHTDVPHRPIRLSLHLKQNPEVEKGGENVVRKSTRPKRSQGPLDLAQMPDMILDSNNLSVSPKGRGRPTTLDHSPNGSSSLVTRKRRASSLPESPLRARQSKQIKMEDPRSWTAFSGPLHAPPSEPPKIPKPSQSLPSSPRPRGRPRKHPLTQSPMSDPVQYLEPVSPVAHKKRGRPRHPQKVGNEAPARSHTVSAIRLRLPEQNHIPQSISMPNLSPRKVGRPKKIKLETPVQSPLSKTSLDPIESGSVLGLSVLGNPTHPHSEPSKKRKNPLKIPREGQSISAPSSMARHSRKSSVRNPLDVLLNCHGCGKSLGVYSKESEADQVHPILKCTTCINVNAGLTNGIKNTRKRQRHISGDIAGAFLPGMEEQGSQKETITKEFSCVLCSKHLGKGTLLRDQEQEPDRCICQECYQSYQKCPECTHPHTNNLGLYRPISLFEKGSSVCSLSHIQIDQGARLRMFDISYGLEHEVSGEWIGQMKQLYLDFLISTNATPEMMEQKGTRMKTVDQIREVSEKRRDLLFSDLFTQVHTVYRKRFLTLAFVDSLTEPPSSGSNFKKRTKVSLRGRQYLVGFSILEWDRKQGYTTLCNLVLKDQRWNSRLSLDLTFLPLQLAMNSQRMDQQTALLAALGDVDDPDCFVDVPTWMYIHCPPPIRQLYTLVHSDHSERVNASLKHLLGLWPMKTGDEEVQDGYQVWTVSLEDLERCWNTTLEAEELDHWTQKGLRGYLDGLDV